MPRHRSSAVPLAWLYGGADRLREPVSVHRLARARRRPARLPAAPLAALLDAVRPGRQPARLPAARLAALRAPGAQRPPCRRGGAARVRRRHAAVVRRWRCCRTTCRSASRRTSTSSSTRSARRSASRSARCCTARGGIERWQKLRDRWFVARSAGGLALLLLWPIGLLFPTAVPFGLGHVLGRVQPLVAELLAGTPVAAWTEAGRAAARRRRGARAGAVAGERALDHRPRPARAVPGGLHDRGAGLAARVLVIGAALLGVGDDDAVDRAQLRPEARVRLDDAAGVAGARRRHRRRAAAEPGAAARRRRLRPDRADRAGDAGRAGAGRSLFRAEPARLGAGPLHPLPRRGAMGRLDLAVRGAVLPAGAPGGARAATADAAARLSRRPSSCSARRCVRDAGSASSCSTSMWLRRAPPRTTGTARGAPGLGDQRVLAKELLALVAADQGDERPRGAGSRRG